MSHMIERIQAIWLSSKKVDRFEHVGRARDLIPFNCFGEESAAVIHAMRLLVERPVPCTRYN
jgi:hypothetical protein